MFQTTNQGYDIKGFNGQKTTESAEWEWKSDMLWDMKQNGVYN